MYLKHGNYDVKQYLKVLERVRRAELRRLHKATYITINDILTYDFHTRPQTIVIEAGNGLGKTQSVCDYVSLIQPIQFYDRIYYLNFSQSACKNIVDKLVKDGCKVVWYIGIDKHCSNVQLLKQLGVMCGVSNYACYVCPYWRPRYRYCYLKFRDLLLSPNIKVVKPEIGYIPYPYCIQPIFRAYVLDPVFEEKRKLPIGFTPVIVIPSQLFLTHTVISKFEKYQRRQKKDRKYLLVIDEADTIFYESLIVELPELDFTNTDIQLLRMFSPKTRRLDKLVDLYNSVIKLCRDILQNRNFVTVEHVNRFLSLKTSIEKLIRSFTRRRREILQYVVNNNIVTNVFKMVNALEEFIHISEPYFTLRSLEYIDGKYVLYDYDFVMKILLDNSYPFKWFWKIVISATFPTEEIFKSRFISPRAKRAIVKATRKYKTYVNVYIAKYEIFRRDVEPLNRNREIRYASKNILDCIYTAVKTYHTYFGVEARGVVVWFGNKYQYNYFISLLQKYKVPVVVKKNYSYFKARIDNEEITVLMSYVGSPFSRSVDLDQYNISIAVAPLLRPPRNKRFWDIVDFSKAIANTLQAVMRIVRSPRPQKPKLIIFDSTLVTIFYHNLTPKWFRELVSTNKLPLLGQDLRVFLQ